METEAQQLASDQVPSLQLSYVDATGGGVGVGSCQYKPRMTTSQKWQELTLMMSYGIVLLWSHVAAGAIHFEDRFYTSDRGKLKGSKNGSIKF